MASYSRFDDEGYKNWLKTTMSLWLLRSRLSGFLENETETFHNSLRNKLKESICKKSCIIKIIRNKVLDVCQDCELWRKEILENHGNKKGNIYWENCKPCLWSSEKWEVAKVYMPRGNKAHSTVDQFDISAILNLMIYCKHFTKFAKQQVLTEVTGVRNQMMHSADMKVLKEDMKKHLNKILALVRQLQKYAPELIDLEKEINQLEEAELNIMVEGKVNNRESPVMNLLDKQKILDLEQQVMKEKIESLASRLEEGRELNKEEYQRMKEFLDENKDLLEQLRPHMEKLKVIQEKLEQHDQQLTVLTVTVDELVKKTEEPVFSADVLRYKNHLLEIARKYNWPTPVFTEEYTPQGYIGKVEVRGQTFKSQNVHPKVKAAHQEASKIALEQLDMQSTEETSQTSSSSSSESSQFFASVKVPVETEFEGPEASSEEASAVEAYRSLEEVLNLGDAGAGSCSDGARRRVHDFFSRAGCRPPEEYHSKTGGKFRSKLCISGDFTFQSQVGMSKKQLAEQATAKEALVRLAGVLRWDLEGMNENYKGRLQELLVKEGHGPPTYKPVYKSCPTEPSHSGAEASVSAESQATPSVDSNQISFQREKSTNETPAPITSTEQPSGRNIPAVAHYDIAPVQAIVHAAPIQKDGSLVSSASGTFFASVTVPVKADFEGPEAESEEAAVVEAYRSLKLALNLGDTGAVSCTGGVRKRVHDFLNHAGCRAPEDCSSTTADGKFRSKLRVSGDLTFQNPEGMSKKQLAEQAAAKEALVRLAGVLGWDLTGMNENCKGRLQELLVRQGHGPPTYKPVYKSCHREPSHSGAESEMSLASVSMTEATVSVGNSKSQAKSSVDSNHTSSQKEKPTNGTPAPVTSIEQLSGHNIPSVTSYDNAPVQDIVLATPIQKDDGMVSSASGTFFASVTVPVKAEFEGPEAGSEEAAVVEAYKSLEQALNLGDTGAGSSSDDARKRVHVFFSRSGCRLPEASSSPTADGKFRSKLCISGDLSFQNPGGMSKKQLAEQAAAKEALFQLAGVLGWDLTGVNENYKGRLQELLVKQGHGPPTYQPVNKSCHTEPSHGGAESEMNPASVPMPEAILSVGNTKRQATPLVDTSQFPPQIEKPMTETPSPMTSTVQPSGKSSSVTAYDTAAVQGIVLVTSIHNDESSISSESSQFFASVKVPVKIKFEGPDAGSEEAAVVEAYKSLEQALSLGDTGAGSCPDGARKRVNDFFSRAGGRPLEEISSTSADGKFRSKLCISDDLNFQNPVGMTKKQKAEQAAAKEALYRLAGVLGWDLAEVNENYKGKLQELVVKEGHGPPTYQPVSKPCHTEPIHREAENSGAEVSPIKMREAVTAAKTSSQSPVDHTQLLPDLKKPKIEYPDFERILKMFGLRPTSVISENMDIKGKFQFTVEINLDDLTYSNHLGYNSKKDAIRKTYLIFGQAIGICDSNTEESQSSMIVKQYFSQKSFSPPIEQVEEKDQKKFYCSLKVATCRLSYEGQGETEEAAKREACNQAVSQLGPLFGYKHKSTCSSEEAAERLTLMLEEAGQGPPALRKTDQLYKATVQLQFKDFTLEIKGQNKKKSAQSELCTKILILLGENDTETGKDVSVRNRVDDWFKQRQLPPPVFEETKESAPDKKEGFGMKATFSGQIICSHSDWQESEEKAVGKLTEELKRRFQAC
ncbi:hypothetical protein GJAV_G00058270 [Gymnothorax javanicus]|nr:hypothetical protein GJAV_G00058270 [Gymnothorax javanicus]